MIPTTPYAATACLISGALIILARNWLARSLMEGLRGFKKDLSSERFRRLGSTGLAIFGLVLMATGLGIFVAIAL